MEILLTIILTLIILIFSVILLSITIISLYEIFIGVPYVPSLKSKNKKYFEEIFKFLGPANKRKFADLGSGDGRIVIEFAKRGFEGYGFELNPLLFYWSNLKKKLLKLNNAHFIRKDFFLTNLEDFDIIYVYQLSKINDLLEEKLKKELKKESLVISYQFQFKNLNLIKKFEKFYIYKT